MKLADLFVQFSIRGFSEFASATSKAKAALEAVATGANAVGGVAQTAFNRASASVLGFVTAGLAGTAQGQYLTYQFQMLSREIAAVFLPTIEKVMNGVREITNWFRQLSGEQQANISKWVLTGIAALGVMAIVPKLIAGFISIAGAIHSATVAITGFGTAAGVSTGGLLPLIGALVTIGTGLTAFADITDKGRSHLGGLLEMGKQLGRELMPIFENIGQGLARIGTALVQMIGTETAIRGIVTVFESLAFAVNLVASAMETLNKLMERLQYLFPDIVEAIGFIANAVNPLTALSTAFKGLSGEGGKTPKGETPPNRLANAVTGFEDVGAQYRRIALASMQASAGAVSPEERAAKSGEETAKNTATMASTLTKLVPRGRGVFD